MPVKIPPNKGVSLPLVIGLVSLLMVASVATSELIVRSVKSARNVEAADRAYFAAEAGIEDALYELAPHYAGYETPALDNAAVRKDDLFKSGAQAKWENNWSVLSRTATLPYSGQLLAKQKLIVSLFTDDSGKGIDANKIDDTAFDTANISTFFPADLTITFRVPFDSSGDYSSAFDNGLQIDNDGDLGSSINGPTGINGLNEDGLLVDDTGACGVGKPPADADCDGRENEDSPEDPVIYWKFSDDQNHSLIPIKGCLNEDPASGLPVGSQICEKNFTDDGTYLSVTLNGNVEGINENNVPENILQFLNRIRVLPAGDRSKLQVEFFTVAPMEQAFAEGGVPKKQPIPYFEYMVNSSEPSMPLPLYTLKSDGYYQDFKQSITTTVMPKTSAPLFDFTIIQQQ